MINEVTSEQAQELVEDAPFGLLFIGTVQPKPTLGEVSVDEQQILLQVDVYQFKNE